MDFKLYTDALKAYTSESGELYVRGTTSSTIRDLHGDEMTLGALKSMEEAAKKNMTVFLNHSYDVPDDLFGSVTDARIVKRTDAESGQEVYDLDVDVRVVGEDENPLAMKTYRAIKRGVKIGLSIGAKVDKVSKQKSANGEDTYMIESVKLLETSVVGIPANQRSYLQSALKSLRQAEESGEIEILENSLHHEDFEEKANAPAPAKDRREGSRTNAPGSASGQGGRISLSSATRKALQNKANEHNAAMKEKDRPSWTRVRVGALRSVYRRGSGAFSTSHRPGIGRAQWSMARVNAFLVLARTGKPANPKYTTDNDLLNSGHPRYSGKKSAIKTVADQLMVGDYVNWDIGGQPAYGEIDEIVSMGMVSLPGTDMSIEASPENPVAIICVYAPHGEDWEESGVYVAVRFNMLTQSNPPSEAGEDEETEMSETEKNLVAEGVVEAASVDEVIDAEKKTRVTVTVSTDGTESAPAAAAAPSADLAQAEEPEDEDDMDAVKASIEPDTKPDAEVVEGEDADKAKEPATTAEAVSVLESLGAVLVRSGDAERKYIAQGLIDLAREIVPGDVVAEEVVAEEPAVAPEALIVEAEVAVVEAEIEVAPVVEETQVAVEEVKTGISLEEIESLAKSALDSAIAAQQEVGKLKERLNDLQESKARVEEDMEKAIGLIGQILDHGVGRKSVTPFTVKTPEAAPWLAPYVRRTLETQE